jgi:hypothetical protein
VSLFDFDKLNRPSARTAPVNPIEIFRTAPALAETPNDLWQGQSKALESWHAQRTQKDVFNFASHRRWKDSRWPARRSEPRQ